jgi:hypothetical protein
MQYHKRLSSRLVVFGTNILFTVFYFHQHYYYNKLEFQKYAFEL